MLRERLSVLLNVHCLSYYIIKQNWTSHVKKMMNYKGSDRKQVWTSRGGTLIFTWRK